MKRPTTLTTYVKCPECHQEFPIQFSRCDREILSGVECPECEEEADDHDIAMAILAEIDNEEAALEDYYDAQKEDRQLFERNQEI